MGRLCLGILINNVEDPKIQESHGHGDYNIMPLGYDPYSNPCCHPLPFSPLIFLSGRGAKNHHQHNQGGDKVNQTAVVRTTEKKNYKPLPLTPLISVSGRGGKHAANQGS
mgnify:FL=1